jgi:hypothetical protein
MSVVITPNFVFGPFKSIETQADRLHCDGIDLPFNALGPYEISEDDSLAPPPPTPEPEVIEGQQ